jgi:hypothetical protein
MSQQWQNHHIQLNLHWTQWWFCNTTKPAHFNTHTSTQHMLCHLMPAMHIRKAQRELPSMTARQQYVLLSTLPCNISSARMHKLNTMTISLLTQGAITLHWHQDSLLVLITEDAMSRGNNKSTPTTGHQGTPWATPCQLARRQPWCVPLSTLSSAAGPGCLLLGFCHIPSARGAEQCQGCKKPQHATAATGRC